MVSASVGAFQSHRLRGGWFTLRGEKLEQPSHQATKMRARSIRRVIPRRRDRVARGTHSGDWGLFSWMVVGWRGCNHNMWGCPISNSKGKIDEKSDGAVRLGPPGTAWERINFFLRRRSEAMTRQVRLRRASAVVLPRRGTGLWRDESAGQAARKKESKVPSLPHAGSKVDGFGNVTAGGQPICRNAVVVRVCGYTTCSGVPVPHAGCRNVPLRKNGGQKVGIPRAGWKESLPCRHVRLWRRCGWLPRGFPWNRCRTRGRGLSRCGRARAGRAIGRAGRAGRGCCPRRCTGG